MHVPIFSPQAATKPASWDQQLAVGFKDFIEDPGLQLTGLFRSKQQRVLQMVTASDLLWSCTGMFVTALALGALGEHAKQLPLVGPLHAQASGKTLHPHCNTCHAMP
jgi:hypothetical protein